MKRTGLRADPDKTRAWVERSRERARERAREAQNVLRAEIARGSAPAASSRALGREGMASSAARRAAASTTTDSDRADRRAALQIRFRAKRPAREQWCVRCAAAGQRRRASSWHHWLPQQHIRTYVRGLRLSAQSTRALLRKLLADERNLTALCGPCHDSHELRSRPLSGEEVPYAARVFALELGPEWAEKLTRLYPGGRVR